MKMPIQTAAALLAGIAIGGVGFGTLYAQTKTPAAYWVTETIEVMDQAAFMNAIKPVFPTVQKFGGKYIVLGGKIAADIGQEPKRITVIAFDNFDKAMQWINDPTAKAARTEVNKYAKTRAYTVEGNPNQ